MTTPATPNVSVGSTEDTSKGGLFVNTSSTNLATEAPESSSTATPAAPDIFSGSTDNAADGSLFTDLNVSGLADDNKIVEIIAGTGLTGTSLTGPQATLEIDSTVATLIGTQTLTNKTLTSPVINTEISGSAFLDEDNLISNSATKVASQQSIKAYVDSSTIAADHITVGDAAVTIATTTGNITIDAQGADTDIIFKGTDNFNDITALTLDMSEAGKAVFNDKIEVPKIRITSTVNASGSSTNHPFEIVAADGLGQNLRLDRNQISAYNAGSAANLFLNPDGGIIVIGSGGMVLGTDDTGINFGEHSEIDLQHIHNTGLRITNGVANATLQFVDANESVSSDGTNLILTSGGNALTVPNSGADTVTLNAATQTLTNKTLTSAVLNNTISGTSIKDEDNMASNSASHLATQQSIKAYVDTQVATVPVGDITSVVAGTGMTGGGTSGDVTLNVIGGTGITANAGDIAIDSTVTTLTGSQTLTNKTLTSPVLNTSISGTAFLDEDDMASNSNIKVASQQSIKAYVDTQVATVPVGDITGVTAGTNLNGGGTSGAVTLNLDAAPTGITSIGLDANNTISFVVNDRINFETSGFIRAYIDDFAFKPQGTTFDIGSSAADFENGFFSGNVISGTFETSGGIITVKNAGAQSEVRLYCESSNAHYAALKAPAHATFSGNVDLTLPSSTGVLKSTGLETIWIPATNMTPRSTNGLTLARITSSGTSYVELEGFKINSTNVSTTCFAEFTIAMPKSWDGGSFTARHFFFNQSGSNWTVSNFYIRAANWQSTSATTPSMGTAANISSTTVNDDVRIGLATGSFTAAGTITGDGTDLVMFQVYKNSSGLGSAEYYYFGSQIFFTTDASNDT